MCAWPIHTFLSKLDNAIRMYGIDTNIVFNCSSRPCHMRFSFTSFSACINDNVLCLSCICLPCTLANQEIISMSKLPHKLAKGRRVKLINPSHLSISYFQFNLETNWARRRSLCLRMTDTHAKLFTQFNSSWRIGERAGVLEKGEANKITGAP
jgi:hypothetical protein